MKLLPTRHVRTLLFFALSLLAARGFAVQIEEGTLRGFILGSCPACAYDNWTSHVSEGIARPGYNDYGPWFLDPQTNGFGAYTLIPSNGSGNQTLSAWQMVFAAAMQEQWETVDSVFSSRSDSWNYESVRLQDSETSREYYLLRERLDSSYVDANVDSIPEDDVIGAFRNGWGLFVFNPAATKPQVIVQMPHPEDDFLSVPVGVELFLRMDARVLMIAGAGREVVWDEAHPPYDNSKSYSDPTRNSRSPFAICHQVAFDALDSGALSPCVTYQIHSYDGLLHGTCGDVQICAYRDDNTPNPPLRDRAEHLDLIHFLARYPVTEVDGDTTIRRRVDDYVSLWSTPPYAYFSEGDTLEIAAVNDLLGAPVNHQAQYSHIGHQPMVDRENFIHVELDEYPDGLWSNPRNWERWLEGPIPATFATYAHAVGFYTPLVAALDSSYEWSYFVVDTVAPPEVSLAQVSALNSTDVYLRWSPSAEDRFFDTYLLYYDTTEISDSSPCFSRASNSMGDLADFGKQGIAVKNLGAPVTRYRFALAARDIWGNCSARSAPLGVTDGPIADLTIRPVTAERLALYWTRQPGDSLYYVHRKTVNDTSFVRSDTTAADSINVPAGGSGRTYYQVWRLLRR